MLQAQNLPFQAAERLWFLSGNAQSRFNKKHQANMKTVGKCGLNKKTPINTSDSFTSSQISQVQYEGETDVQSLHTANQEKILVPIQGPSSYYCYFPHLCDHQY